MIRDRLYAARAVLTEAYVSRAPVIKARRSHGLGKPLIVSLTSYPPRYSTLYPTLKSLLRQDVAADQIILWLAEKDLTSLPPSVRRLARRGLQIKTCENYGPFKKFVGTRRLYNDAFIVTADDDVYYPQAWLSELVSSFLIGPPAVIAFRARMMLETRDGYQHYDDWPFIYTPMLQSDDLLPNGVGGVLYPPGSLPDESINVQLFQKLCARNDDPWLMWMSRRAGFTTRMVHHPREPMTWRGSQDVALWRIDNTGENGRNDGYMQALFNHFGRPISSLKGA